MNSRKSFNIKGILILAMALCLSACNDVIPKRATISPSNSVTDGPATCPEGQHLGDPVADPETGEETQECVDDPVTRPSGAVVFTSDFCGCKDGVAVTYGNCSSFCASRQTSGNEYLYANFTLGAAIALSGLSNVAGWCNTPLETGQQNPKCQLEAKDESGSITMTDVTVNANSIQANIAPLTQDKPYVITLVETVSGARSNSVQIIKYSADTGIPVVGPLKNAPISQYSCVIRDPEIDSQTGDIYWKTMFRLHFYFIPRIPPLPIPAGSGNLVCHDIFNPLYGKIDDELYPRLELVPAAFNIWDNTDPRFYDNNSNNIMDVNEIIIQKVKNFGGSIPSSSKFFQEIKFTNSPVQNSSAGNTGASSTQPLGYYMAPWIDTVTFKSYCLNSTHYNSSNPIYKALRDVIEVDTEGLYIGYKQAESTTVSGQTTTITGSEDMIYIRETDLKAVWFYLNNGVPTVPTETNVGNVAVYFYYPLNKASPFVKTSTQRLYRVRSASELNQATGTNSTSSTLTGYPAHDRKIGCIPKF